MDHGAEHLPEGLVGLVQGCPGTVEEHIIYCFTIYDLNADGFISKEEMLTMLKTCLVKSGMEEDGDEGVKVELVLFLSQDLIEMTMKKMDEDKDGRVSFADFEVTVTKDPLMLEAFGPCLPTVKVTVCSSPCSVFS